MIIGIVMFIRSIRNSRRPRIDVQILEIKPDPEEVKGQSRLKREPARGRAIYTYNGQEYESWVMLLKETKINEHIEVSVNPKNPKDLNIHSPGKEQIAVLVVFGIGFILFFGSWLIVQNYLGGF